LLCRLKVTRPSTNGFSINSPKTPSKVVESPSSKGFSDNSRIILSSACRNSTWSLNFGAQISKLVWTALLDIPYGQVISYGELARRLGRHPEASRAVGSANGANPLPIVVPCHRVIGQNGKLVGYGGGLETKAWLLRLEAQQESLPFGLSQEDTENKKDIPARGLQRSRGS
jgi:O-6-methylguanine DNA methyltransferase